MYYGKMELHSMILFYFPFAVTNDAPKLRNLSEILLLAK